MMDLKTILYSAAVYVFQMESRWLVAYTITIIFAGLLWFEKWNRRSIDKLASTLPGPKAYPLIGSLHQLMGSTEHVMDFIDETYRKYSPGPVKFWLGRSLSIVLMKPIDLQIVLNSSSALDKGLFNKLFKDYLGEGLVSAPVHKWKKHRRMITPMFNAISMNQFIRIFNEKNQILVKNITKEVGNSQPFDISNYIEPTSLDIICKCAMGYEINASLSNKKSSFAAIQSQVKFLSTKRISNPLLYPDIIYSIYLKLTGKYNVYEKFHELPMKIINEKREAVKNRNKEQNSSSKGNDHQNNERSKLFLDAILELNETGSNFSDEEIKDEVLTIMGAGFETITVTICFCFLLLGMHPEIQDKVYDEIYEVFGDGDQLITIEDASKLIYLEQVLKETLRLYSPIPLIFREIKDDIVIDSGNLTLPKGTMCILLIRGVHRLPELYPNPLSFNPENFNEENIAKRPKYSFIPFGGGPRICLGTKFSMLSMIVTVSTLLRNFSVHTDIKQSDIKLKLEVLTKSVHGYPVTIRQRDRRPSHMKN